MLSFEQFVEQLKTIPVKITTENDATYNDIKLQTDTIAYYRGSREFYGGKRKPLIDENEYKRTIQRLSKFRFY